MLVSRIAHELRGGTMPPSETPVGHARARRERLSDQTILDHIEKLELGAGDMIVVRAPAGTHASEQAQWASNLRRLPQMTGHVVMVMPAGVDVAAYPAADLISVMKNAIGFSLYSGDREHSVTDAGVPSIEVSDEESAECGAAAQLAYEHLIKYVSEGRLSRNEQ